MDVELVDDGVQLLGSDDFIFIQPQPPYTPRTRDPSQPDPATKKKVRVKRHLCPECGLPCSSPSTLACHMRTHTGEKPYHCSECSYRTAQIYTLRAHMRKHTGEKPFQCKHCEYKSAFAASLRAHLRRHSGEKPFKCPHCDYMATTKGNLRLHMSRHLPIPELQAVSSLLSCDSCSFSSNDSTVFDEHMKEHPGHSRDLKKAFRRMYSCNQCDYTCRHPHSIKVHLLKHKHLPDVNCRLCSYKCYTKQAMRIHFRRQHSDQRPSYECPECSRKFTAKPSLNVHMRLHTGERPFPCNVCSFRAISRTVLKEHMIRHDSEVEKPFPCFLCDARFNWPHEWKAHMFTHRDQDFEKSKYCCSYCDYSSPLKRNLSSHMTMKHRDLVKQPDSFYCEDCKYDFKKRNNWNRHVRLCHREKLES